MLAICSSLAYSSQRNIGKHVAKRTAREPTGIVDDALLDFGMQSGHTLIIKRHLSTNQDVKHDTKTPNINLRPRIGSSLQQLRGGKVQAATKGLEVTARCKEVAQAKVDDLDVARLANKYIFDLEIAVDDTVPMAIIESACDLTTELAGLLLLQLSMGDDVVKHLAAIHELEQHIPVVVGPNHVLQGANMGMVEEGDNGSFASRSNFLGLVRPLLISSAMVAIIGGASGDDFTSHL